MLACRTTIHCLEVEPSLHSGRAVMCWSCFGVRLGVEIGLWMSKCARDGVNRRYIPSPGTSPCHFSVFSHPPLDLDLVFALPDHRPVLARVTKLCRQVGVFSLASGILRRGEGEGEGTRACSSDEYTSFWRKIRVSSLAPGIFIRVVDGADGFRGRCIAHRQVPEYLI